MKQFSLVSSLRRAWAIACVSGALALGAPFAAAQSQTPSLANVVSIAASGELEVEQDWLTLTLSTSREGSDAAFVQNQLRQALDAALALAKASAEPRRLDVRTGQIGVFPRYGNNGRITGWQGTVELVLEGRDFVRISSVAGKIQTMTISGSVFSLSREAQQKLESDAQSLAIDRFKAKAGEVAKGFGFSAYTLRELVVSTADQGARPVYPRAMAAQAKVSMSSADAAVPMEAGRSVVQVSVSGTIQLR